MRIYTGDDGQSHLEEMDAPTEPVHRIATKPGEDLVFRRSPENSFSDWHNPSRRQYLFVLDGQMEVSVKDGTTLLFSPGDVLLAEDMTGQGHVTKSVGGPYTSVSMGIPD
ncbi:MAG: hypothetical protein IH872_12910 [Chloroflexi bacterium]|nr:hypothetical protein [Chloroflexota bacterium]